MRVGTERLGNDQLHMVARRCMWRGSLRKRELAVLKICGEDRLKRRYKCTVVVSVRIEIGCE